MLAGVWRRSATLSKASSGAGPCASPGVTKAVAANTATRIPWIRFMVATLVRARPRSGGFEEDLLRAPLVDLGRVEHVRIAAVDLVRGGELARGLAPTAELADHLAVQFHLVDFARELGGRSRGAVGPRVRHVQILLAGILRARAAGYAHGPRVADA